VDVVVASSKEIKLPDLADLVRWLHHRPAGLAGECLRELGHVHQHPVDTILRRGMRVSHGTDAQILGRSLAQSHWANPMKKRCFGSEAVHQLKVFVLGGVFPCRPTGLH